ncbi:MAG TPA: redoxin domain-containing protein [Gemmatales bacterium]|nr:redoxin domain-containing protein [Gemmatales bacterium]
MSDKDHLHFKNKNAGFMTMVMCIGGILTILVVSQFVPLSSLRYPWQARNTVTAPEPTKTTVTVADRAERYLQKKNVTPLSGSLQTLLTNPSSFLVKTQDHLLLGKHCSEFTLKDNEGKDWNLGDALGKKPIVLIFYQGYECDHCVAQLFGINKDVAQFREMDAQIVAVSPDEPGHTRKQYAKYGSFAFPVLSDPDKKVAEQFGVYELPDPNGAGTLYHATFVIDAEGVIRWANKDFEPFVNNRTLLYEVAKLTGRLPVQQP